jgi:hypothetical protein
LTIGADLERWRWRRCALRWRCRLCAFFEIVPGRDDARSCRELPGRAVVEVVEVVVLVPVVVFVVDVVVVDDVVVVVDPEVVVEVEVEVGGTVVPVSGGVVGLVGGASGEVVVGGAVGSVGFVGSVAGAGGAVVVVVVVVVVELDVDVSGAQLSESVTRSRLIEPAGTAPLSTSAPSSPFWLVSSLAVTGTSV